MIEPESPLTVERAEPVDGLTVVRQAPPASAASFAVSFVALAGYAFDPPGQEGTAQLVTELLGSGAGRFARLPFAREMDRLGATITTRAAPESIEVIAWGPEEARDRVLELWALSILKPRFDAEDVARAKRHLIERQLREAAQPDSRAERELYHTIFPPGHPYRETGSGTPRAVRAISRRHLRAFHGLHFRRTGSMVVGTTRLSVTGFRRAVQTHLAKLPRGTAVPSPTLKPSRKPPAAPRRVVMHGHSQVEIRMGGPSIPRSSTLYPAAFLVNEVLGGRPLLARLFQTVREEHGLAYDCGSEVEAMRWGGLWQVHAGTGPERIGKVVALLDRELRRIREERVPAGELERVRESAIGQIPLALETTSGAHELAVDVTYHDLPTDFYLRWPEMLRSLRPADLQEAARAAFDPAFHATVIAGPAPD
jgi:zinc protease